MVKLRCQSVKSSVFRQSLGQQKGGRAATAIVTIVVVAKDGQGRLVFLNRASISYEIFKPFFSILDFIHF
jgi:hypothetical protein